MMSPVDDAGAGESPGLQEVRDAYGGLPPLEPGAALDARVRAAVAAELAAGRVVPLPHPRWRRVALPLATAATLVIAVGLWQLRGTHDVAHESMIVASAPVVMVGTGDAPVPAPRADVASKRLAVASPPAPMPADAALAERAADETARLDYASAPPPVASGAVAAPEARARVADVPAADEPVFAEARHLLAAGHRDAARALVARWQAAHAGMPLPADLQPLAAEAPPGQPR